MSAEISADNLPSHSAQTCWQCANILLSG